jgi:hypothetical protein
MTRSPGPSRNSYDTIEPMIGHFQSFSESLRLPNPRQLDSLSHTPHSVRWKKQIQENDVVIENRSLGPVIRMDGQSPDPLRHILYR